jgi:hypothetical protein
MANPKPVKVSYKRDKRASVKVEGMRDFRKDLKQMTEDGGKDGRKLLKEANYKVATFVLRKAQKRAATVGPQQVNAAGSMQAKSTATTAQIRTGVNFLYFNGAEFGADRNVRRVTNGRPSASGSQLTAYTGWKQFKDWKKPNSGNTGYFLFPTLRHESKEINEIWGREFDEISSKVFPDGR